MKLAMDAHYFPDCTVRVAAVFFRDWRDRGPRGQADASCAGAAAYHPGLFYRRELPCLLTLISELDFLPELIIVDGYVWLGPGRPGLGARLWQTLGGKIAVIGVAKNPFAGAPHLQVRRGGSRRPLYVTSAGIPSAQAAAAIRSMWGPYRLPALLKLADRLARRIP